MSMFDKIKLWFTGGEQEARESSDHNSMRAAIGLPTAFEGDRQDDADGTILGGVVWPVEPGSHGARAFVTSWCFIAEYDAKKREVYLLDNTGKQRHPGAVPLRVDDGDITIYSGKKRSGIGYVTRTALFGLDATGAIGENVFKHFDADLIAHHLLPDPPDNSSIVYDPDNEGRGGGLHWVFRVRAWADRLCRGKTTSDDGEEIFAVMLNYGKNGDGTPAYGLAHFNRGDATLSDEGGGPTACADDGNHVIARTKDGLGHQGALNIEALHGPISTLYMPEEWRNQQHPRTAGGPFKLPVWKQPDFTVKHKNYCGREVDGKLRWHAESPIREYPPPHTPPDEPPPEDPPTDDPPPIIPSPIYVPHEPRPTTATPNELEAPSEYGHPVPSIPDGETDWPGGGHSSSTPQYNFDWRSKLGFTEEEWNRVNLTHHDSAIPVYLYDEPQAGVDRWPTVKDSHEELVVDDTGFVVSRKAATGPGTKMLQPAWARAWHGLQKFKHLWKSGTHEISRIIMAGKNAAGDIVNGRFGMGMRDETDAIPRAGFDITLDFSSDADNPDTNFTARDETGATGTGRFVFNGGDMVINGLTIGGTEIDPTGGVPVGTLVMYGAASAPTGWLLCDGSILNISSYPALGALLGSTYGGNGTTTFGVPDLRGRSPLGYGAGPGLTSRSLNDSGGGETATLGGGTDIAAGSDFENSIDNMHPYRVVNFIIKT